MKILKALQNVGFMIILFVKDDVKVKNRCHVTWKYRGAAQRDCNINVSLN